MSDQESLREFRKKQNRRSPLAFSTIIRYPPVAQNAYDRAAFRLGLRPPNMRRWQSICQAKEKFIAKVGDRKLLAPDWKTFRKGMKQLEKHAEERDRLHELYMILQRHAAEGDAARRGALDGKVDNVEEAKEQAASNEQSTPG